MLDELRDIAFRFQIDPNKTVGHAARISSVISVLSNINQSFQNFLEVEFFKNEEFVKAFEQNSKVLESLKEDLERKTKRLRELEKINSDLKLLLEENSIDNKSLKNNLSTGSIEFLKERRIKTLEDKNKKLKDELEKLSEDMIKKNKEQDYKIIEKSICLNGNFFYN